jgi:hypothetical protein
VLDAGWCGEDVFVRLLSAGGTIRVIGHPLAGPVSDPRRHLEAALVPDDRGRVPVALIRPEHLWLRNRLEASSFIHGLLADGITVFSLERASILDRGVSRAVCGPNAEVLPATPVPVDPGHVMVFARECADAHAWFAEVVADASRRLVFEADLETSSAREATAARIGALLVQAPWPVPADRDVPTSTALWSRVTDADAVRGGVDRLARLAG